MSIRLFLQIKMLESKTNDHHGSHFKIGYLKTREYKNKPTHLNKGTNNTKTC